MASTWNLCFTTSHHCWGQGDGISSGCGECGGRLVRAGFCMVGFSMYESMAFLVQLLSILCDIVPVTFLISLLFPVNCTFLNLQALPFTILLSLLPQGLGEEKEGVSESVHDLESLE